MPVFGLERMAEAARRCMAELDGNRQDISMLFLLSHVEWLERFPAGEKLVEWVRTRVKLKVGQVCCKEFRDAVVGEFKARGIRPVAPERCVYATTKQEAKDLCLAAGWPEPFFPFMLQTRPKDAGGFTRKKKDYTTKYDPMEKGVFIMFSCWQDAFHALIAIAGTNKYKGHPADIVFENQLADMGPRSIPYPCRIILDCDAKRSEFNNEYTLGELQESIDRVAPWFAKQLVVIGAIKPTDRVVCFQKNKSRENKASCHLVFNIMGLPTLDIREVLDRVFVSIWREVEKKRKEQEEQGEIDKPNPKKKPKLKARTLPEPWQVTDRAPMHGRGQFSTLLLKNPDKNETEYPFVEWRLVIVNGEIKERNRMRVERADSGPDHPQALPLLHCCCYSSFVSEFITLSPNFMVEKPSVGVSAFYYYCWVGPAARLELTRTPDGGRQKGWGLAGRVLDQGALPLRPPGSPAMPRISCRDGPSQPPREQVGAGAQSTLGCQAWTRCTPSCSSLSLRLSERTRPTSLAPSSAPTPRMIPRSTRTTGYTWSCMRRSCTPCARIRRAMASAAPVRWRPRWWKGQASGAIPGSSTRKSRMQSWRAGPMARAARERTTRTRTLRRVHVEIPVEARPSAAGKSSTPN